METKLLRLLLLIVAIGIVVFALSFTPWIAGPWVWWIIGTIIVCAMLLLLFIFFKEA
jgi:hypothetical protein